SFDPSEDYIPAIVGLEHLRSPAPLFPGMVFELTSFSPVPPHAPRSRRFIVAGYFKTGLYELDSNGVILRLEDADEFLALRGEDGELRVSAVRVTVDNEHRSEAGLLALRDRIESTLSKHDMLFLDVETWREARAAILQAVLMEKFIVSIILGVVILFAGFMIFIILTVQAVERSRDIGVLISLGATPRHIGAIYFLIGFTLCVVGTVLGAIYGIGFAVWINPIQRWIDLLTGYEVFPKDLYYLDRIPVEFNPQDLIFIIIPTVAASLIASLIPAIRAARRDPLVSLRTR
ncbi:MAG TPA: FtsX-like permease family protein, partial [Planctomycetota bacterium]|nr:FtsX-like permease family protein [Planctomycetota bacterium]